MSVATQETFGNDVYHELRRTSGFETLTQTLDFESIQRLKQANREATIRLFADSGVHINSDSELEPKTVAECVIEEARRRAMTGRQVTAGMTVLDIVIQILSGIAACV